METYIDYRFLNEKQYVKSLIENGRLHIFGAGNFGNTALHILKRAEGINVSGIRIYDNDSTKWGTQIQGHKVCSPTEMRDNSVFILAVASEIARAEIEKQLQRKGDYKIVSYFALCLWDTINENPMKMKNKMRYACIYQQWIYDRINGILGSVEEDVLVYSAGKTGSTTLIYALKNAGVSSKQTHYFFFGTKNTYASENILPPEMKRYFPLSSYFDTYDYRKEIQKVITGKKIIVPVREPIAQEVSQVFQWVGRPESQAYFASKSAEGYSFAEALEQLLECFRNWQCRWFDTELFPLCDVNIYDYAFDREKGWSVINKNSTEILLIKTESMDQNVDVIRKFVQNDRVELINQNVGQEKPYTHIYKEFKKQLVVPEEYLDFYYDNNPWVNYFYTREEQSLFRKRWTK